MNVKFADDYDVELVEKGRTVLDMITAEVTKANSHKNDQHFWLCDLGQVIRLYQTWTQLMPRVHPFYAVKCNGENPILKVLADLGSGFDCASKNEIQGMLDLGVSTSRIIYANPCKQASMLRYAAKQGVERTVFDNIEELHKIKEIQPNASLVLRITVDINDKGSHDLDSKFGCNPSATPDLFKTARKLNLSVVGVCFHVGSNCHKPNTFAAGIQHARSVFDIGLQHGFHMKLLDIGGGFPGDIATFRQITARINQALDEYFPQGEGYEIIGEPGRYLVQSACVTVANIISRRTVPDPNTADDKDTVARPYTMNGSATSSSRMMYYVNDGLYGSFSAKYGANKQFEPKAMKNNSDEKVYESCVWGPSLDSFDVIRECIRLPLLEVGDWVYFEDMGAYTVAVTTNFGGMGAPRHVYYCHADTWYKLYPNEV